MRGISRTLAVACAALACWAAPAAAATQRLTDVPAGFWAGRQITWAVKNGWISPRTPTLYGVKHTVSRRTASDVLARLNMRQTGQPIAPDPYAQAVAAGWISAGTGFSQPITQRQFDAGLVRVLGMGSAAKQIGALVTAGGWRPPLPNGFGVEQVVRALGLRANAPAGSDQWEQEPNDDLTRTSLAVEAFAARYMPSGQTSLATAKTAVATALPALTPLQQKVIRYALRFGGYPYVWGGESTTTSSPYGAQAAGGFDCSGFVWWVLKMHTYSVAGHNWNASAQITARDTYSMAKALPVARRIPRAHLHPGDIAFWSTAPNGVHTNWSTVEHTGIYLGGGWVIDSNGSSDGVTLDYMGAGAGWYHDAFAFGWRVLPRGA